ncbi:Zinc finger CCCH domain-containing protein 28 [Tetrabaena socialis]|uniref:Zinc finger CCCH domain-containing protein 28 n=1 Tax=Tetrabaena socialis TaxID=47790 RepID=A0A2J7ZR56_9CHLO|nr:Zinc finger CCCH domain-containing protein 28 [Tetrabaena socialis]|eukprot:PNH02761.1 Zinc finger CCCH domain-containing protein 28 [Tetrabaena socialis]
MEQLTQRFDETSLASSGSSMEAGTLGNGDPLSSGDATAQHSGAASESSSATENLGCQLDSGCGSGSLEYAQQTRSQHEQQSRSQHEAHEGLTQQEGKSQICFDFTKGVCSRGDKCKYSHDLATIVHFNSKEKGICFDYLRNQCHRGLLCRFSHDLSNIAQQCQVYNNGAKENKGAKPNAICYDFVKGVCQRGVDCRYSHDLSLIARMARGGSAQPKAGEVCYDYLRGRCNRGATCKYSHNIAFLAAPGFLGSDTPADGAPMPAQASGPGMHAGGPPMGGMPLGHGSGGYPVNMGGMHGGMPQRLSPALSADQATFNHVMAAAGQGAVNQMFAMQQHQHQANSMAAAEAAERRRRSGSISGEASNEALSANDQPPGSWHGMPPALPKNNMGGMAQHHQAAMMNSMAVQQHQQRMAHMAHQGANNMHNSHIHGHVPVLGMPGGPGQHHGVEGFGHHHPGGGMSSGMFGKAPGMGHFGGPEQAGHGMRRPPLHPGHMPAEIAALFGGGMPENPGVFAEALAVAKAQAQAQHQAQNQSARMSNGSMLSSMGSGGGGLPSMSGGGGPAMPQPIPGRDNMLAPHGGEYYAASNASFASNGPQPGGGVGGGGHPMVEHGHLSRSAPTGGPLHPNNVNPDLLPMIKEIWSKPGAVLV